MRKVTGKNNIKFLKPQLCLVLNANICSIDSTNALKKKALKRKRAGKSVCNYS